MKFHLREGGEEGPEQRNRRFIVSFSLIKHNDIITNTADDLERKQNGVVCVSNGENSKCQINVLCYVKRCRKSNENTQNCTVHTRKWHFVLLEEQKEAQRVE